MQHNLENQIRERAYELWATNGQNEGQADQHWLTAEREILAAFASGQPAAPAKPKAKVAAPKSKKRAA